jgi:flagellar protein FliO/FliZ
MRTPTAFMSMLAGLAVPIDALAAAGAPGAAQLAKLVVGLVVVIAAVLVLSRVLARMGGMRSQASSQFRVVTALAVGQKERVVLVQAGERQILLGVTPTQVNALHVLDEPLPVDEPRSDHRAAHDGWLAATLGRRSG